MKLVKVIFGILLLFVLFSFGGCYLEKNARLKITNYYKNESGVSEDLICVDWNGSLFTNGTTTNKDGEVVPCLKYGTSLEIRVYPGDRKITFIRASDGAKYETINYVDIPDAEPYDHYYELWQSNTQLYVK